MSPPARDNRKFRPRLDRSALPADSAGRMPPNNPDFERAFLGAVMCEGDGLIFDKARAQGLAPEWFYGTAHQIIAESMVALRADNCLIREIEVAGHLAGTGELAAIGGPAYLNELTRQDISLGWETWVAAIKEKFVQRSVLSTALSITEAVYAPVQRKGDFNAQLVPLVNGLLRYTQDDDDGRLAEDTLDTIERQFETALRGEVDEEAEKRKISFGLPCLDRHFRKLSAEDGDNLIVIAATPGAGKSSLADLMAKTGLCEGKVVVKHSLETTNKASFLSIAALDSGIPMSVAGDAAALLRVRAKIYGMKHPVDKSLAEGVAFFDAQFSAAAAAWKKAIEIQRKWFAFFRQVRGKSFFPYDHTRKLDDIIATSRLAARSAGRVDLIIVDYLQEVKVHRGNLRGDEMLGEVCRELKDLSKELRCPVVLLSTLNRAVDGGRPSMSHLRGSGDIEAAADGVITLWRPDKDSKGNENRPSEKREWVEVWAEQFNKRNRTHWRELLHFHGPLKKFKDISSGAHPEEYRPGANAKSAVDTPAAPPAATVSTASSGYGEDFEKRGRGRPPGVRNGQGAYRPESHGGPPESSFFSSPEADLRATARHFGHDMSDRIPDDLLSEP